MAATPTRPAAAPGGVDLEGLQRSLRRPRTLFSYLMSLLTGAAIHQYDTYFQLVTRDAPAQKLVVTTRVTNSGVELLTGNQARLLVFANQQDTRAGTKQTSYAGALFAVTAVRQGGRWKIENIDTFSG